MTGPPIAEAPVPNLQDTVVELEGEINNLFSEARALNTRLTCPGDTPEVDEIPQPVNLRARIIAMTNLVKETSTNMASIESYLGV